GGLEAEAVLAVVLPENAPVGGIEDGHPFGAPRNDPVPVGRQVHVRVPAQVSREKARSLSVVELVTRGRSAVVEDQDASPVAGEEEIHPRTTFEDATGKWRVDLPGREARALEESCGEHLFAVGGEREPRLAGDVAERGENGPRPEVDEIGVVRP